VTGWEQVRADKETVEGNGPHGGHEYVCEGVWLCFGVRIDIIIRDIAVPTVHCLCN
jgi:hypothetical protein